MLLLTPPRDSSSPSTELLAQLLLTQGSTGDSWVGSFNLMPPGVLCDMGCLLPLLLLLVIRLQTSVVLPQLSSRVLMMLRSNICIITEETPMPPPSQSRLLDVPGKLS